MHHWKDSVGFKPPGHRWLDQNLCGTFHHPPTPKTPMACSNEGKNALGVRVNFLERIYPHISFQMRADGLYLHGICIVCLLCICILFVCLSVGGQNFCIPASPEPRRIILFSIGSIIKLRCPSRSYIEGVLREAIRIASQSSILES